MASIPVLIKRTFNASVKHQRAMNELWAAYLDRYGTTPNDLDLDEIIDVTDYGQGASNVALKRLDDLMTKAGFPPIKKITRSNDALPPEKPR